MEDFNSLTPNEQYSPFNQIDTNVTVLILLNIDDVIKQELINPNLIGEQIDLNEGYTEIIQIDRN